MLKRITRTLKEINDEVDRDIAMKAMLQHYGINMNRFETPDNIERMFWILVNILDKPHYDGVIERLMEKHFTNINKQKRTHR